MLCRFDQLHAGFEIVRVVAYKTNDWRIGSKAFSSFELIRCLIAESSESSTSVFWFSVPTLCLWRVFDEHNRCISFTVIRHAVAKLEKFDPSNVDSQWIAETHCFRVWTQLIQHLIANMYIMLWKLIACFSKRVASLRISFILQKKRSTILRMA